MSQTKLESFFEASLNVAIGFGVSLLANMFILPLYGVHVSFAVDIQVTLWFTVISLLRSYLIRRYMNKKDVIAAPEPPKKRKRTFVKKTA